MNNRQLRTMTIVFKRSFRAGGGFLPDHMVTLFFSVFFPHSDGKVVDIHLGNS